VEVEIALGRAEAHFGVIPPKAAEQIAEARAEKINIEALTKGTLHSGFPIIALVEELRKQVGSEAAPFVHWGATTQDIMDTACILQLRSATELFKTRLTEIVRDLSVLAGRHRNLVLAGRTHGQQALPITFGIKIAPGSRRFCVICSVSTKFFPVCWWSNSAVLPGRWRHSELRGLR
jgi:3-carboxy-cis,cis-muconate cycloisomerase